MLQVDAVKRNCIKVLPHTLVIHLKRFEFDYETMNRWKIKDRFAFPLRLDMHPYTVDGLAEADAAASGKVCQHGRNQVAVRRSLCRSRSVLVAAVEVSSIQAELAIERRTSPA